MFNAATFDEFMRRSAFACGWSDLDGNILFANPALGRLLDNEPDDLKGTNVQSYYPDDFKDKLRQHILPTVIDKGEWLGEVPLLSPKGRLTPCIQNVFLLRDASGNPQFFANIITDISERKRHADQLAAAHQQVEATNQQLTASNQQLKAANEQLKAANEQMNAAGQQLRAANLELRTHEQAMRIERDRARTYFDVAGVMFVEINADGDIVAVNPKGCEVLGYEQAELIGRNWFDTCLPKSLTADVKSVFSRLVAGELEPVEFYKNRVVTKTGSERIIAWHNTVLRDAGGNITDTFSSGEDITDREAAEQRLRESEERYRAFFDRAAEGILVADAESKRFLHANPAICRMLGYTRSKLTQLSVSDIHPPESLSMVVAAFEAQVREEKLTAGELPCLRKDGSVFYADISGAPTTIDGVRCSIGFFSDVTSRREAEQQREQLIQADKLASLGTLVAGVAHEINNPNSFIMLNTSGLRDMWNDMLPAIETYCKEHNTTTLGMSSLADIRKDGPELIALIARGAERIKNIVLELKTFAREGDTDMNAPVDLNKVATSAVTLVENRLKQATAGFTVDYGKALPCVRGNFQRLEQVVLNLLINACDACPGKDRVMCISQPGSTRRTPPSYSRSGTMGSGCRRTRSGASWTRSSRPNVTRAEPGWDSRSRRGWLRSTAAAFHSIRRPASEPP